MISLPLPLATLLAAILLFGIAVFHGAVAFGAPLAAYAWGGQAEHGPLPPRQQLGSTILAPFIAAMAILLLIRGGWLFPDLSHALVWAAWAVFLFVVTQMFGALRSTSRKERLVMTPVYAVTTIVCAIVAFNIS